MDAINLAAGVTVVAPREGLWRLCHPRRLLPAAV